MDENVAVRPINPTQIAQDMAFQTFDLDEAVRYLNEDFQIRRVDEVLSWAIRIKAEERATARGVATADIKTVEAELKKNLGQDNEENLKNWTTPRKTKSIDRESAIKIAFALRMSHSQTDDLLKKFWHDGLYLRDLRDVLYRHGLENGWTYNETIKIIDDFAELDHNNPEVDNNMEAADGLTKYLDIQSSSAGTKEELEAFIRQNKEFFGSFRRKAYVRFKELYDELKGEKDFNAGIDYAINKEAGETKPYARKKVSTKQLCSEIVKGIPEMKKKGTNKALCQLIAEHIPTRTAMSEIINKYERNGNTAQVDRKLLMLAWLACEDGKILDFNMGQEDEAFEDHIGMVNDLLDFCSMPMLDARHSFDWILMNTLSCVYRSNMGDDADIEERLQSFINRLKNMEDD